MIIRSIKELKKILWDLKVFIHRIDSKWIMPLKAKGGRML